MERIDKREETDKKRTLNSKNPPFSTLKSLLGG
jgi:hypothetical protein